MRSLLPISRQQNGGGGGGGGSGAELYLNVYDLTPINNLLYWFGLGIFHSGIEVHDMEYAYGARAHPASGVSEVEPKSRPGVIYRCSLLLGTVDMSRSEFRAFMENLSVKYDGDTYHMIAKNCNHFTDDVCMRLTGKPIPGWVNRFARIGSFFNAALPQSIQIAAVPHLPMYMGFSAEGSENSGPVEKIDGNDPYHHLLTIPNGEITRLRKHTGKTY